MGKFIDLTGQKFHYLTVLNRHSSNDNNNKPLWDCKCICDNTVIVNGNSLRTGATKSCGCYSKEVASTVHKGKAKTHGMYAVEKEKVPHEFNVWKSMVTRIRRPHKETYKQIDIDPRWDLDFNCFLEDMGKMPSCHHQIDRIDNTKGYWKENCRWATPKENCRNKSNNIKITWNGETKCLYEWAEIICPILNIQADTLQWRIKSGMSVEKAFTTKNQQPKKELIFWQGEEKTLSEWAKILAPKLGLSERTITSRVSEQKWDIEKAFTEKRKTNQYQ